MRTPSHAVFLRRFLSVVVGTVGSSCYSRSAYYEVPLLCTNPPLHNQERAPPARSRQACVQPAVPLFFFDGVRSPHGFRPDGRAVASVMPVQMSVFRCPRRRFFFFCGLRFVAAGGSSPPLAVGSFGRPPTPHRLWFWMDGTFDLFGLGWRSSRASLSVLFPSPHFSTFPPPIAPLVQTAGLESEGASVQGGSLIIFWLQPPPEGAICVRPVRLRHSGFQSLVSFPPDTARDRRFLIPPFCAHFFFAG